MKKSPIIYFSFNPYIWEDIVSNIPICNRKVSTFLLSIRNIVESSYFCMLRFRFPDIEITVALHKFGNFNYQLTYTEYETD